MNLLIPVPSLLPPHRSPSITSLWLFFLSLLILLPSLFLFEFTSTPTATLHISNTFALLILLILLCALTVFREGEVLIATPAAALAWLSCAWAWAAGRVVESVRIKYKLEQPPRAFHQEEVFWARPSSLRAASFTGNLHRRDSSAASEERPNERSPLLSPYITTIHVPLKRAQSGLGRSFKLLFATVGTTAVTACLVLLIFDVALTGADSGYAPQESMGERVWINLRNASTTVPKVAEEGPDAQGWKKASKRVSLRDFRVHIKCESALDSTFRPSTEGASLKRSKRPRPPPSNSVRPTALVMSERGVSGVKAAEWVREMVANARDEGGKDGDDGHLALESVCFWDRLGYGFSDFVEGASGDVPLHTEILKRALEDVGAWTLPPPANSTNLTTAGARQEYGGPFMIISTGYGSLFAQHFAATYPEMVHSRILIDAETPESWYTDVVDRRSGLRAGHAAPGHNRIGLLVKDLLPVLLSPLGITHLLGLVAGNGPSERLLSPRHRGGSPRSDFGGGGFRIAAGGSSQKLLTTSLHERLDANNGKRSPNFKALMKTSERDLEKHALAKKPTAVLSSFWKTHRDLSGWGDQQRNAVVKPALDQGGLVGWWRIGNRIEVGSGGSDIGEAQGICESGQGRVFCNEAVRKILATADLNEKEGVQSMSREAAEAALTFDVGQNDGP